MDYLRTERESSFRREYVGGFWYGPHGEAADEDGASAGHGLIKTNLLGTLYPTCRGLGFRLFSSQFKLHIAEKAAFYSPDVMGCLDAPEDDSYATSPCLLAEIVSERSEWTDRHAKYHAYTSIPSLQTYLIVEQDERRVYAYEREGGEWELQELAGRGSVHISCLGRTLSLDDIYAWVL
ncbi:Uma2 family endonuclease [Deinococcus sp. YIM 134068]|uniref:Uma2 family endonuclease n=1 Tax=Deinococcus lichenicola TaxID=3118910 RepID=UPI002F944C4D